MNWVRSRVRQGALLALLALAIQLVLSFGHFHSDGIARAAALTAQAEAATAPLSGPYQHRDGLAADGCAICASIALAGTLLASAPPTLPVPASFAVWTTTISAGFTQPELARPAFQSRAPPRS
jgi:hypothetical protein